MAGGLLRGVGCLAVAVALGALAGCSGSGVSGASEPAGRVLANVRTDVLAAKSVRVSGFVKHGSMTLVMDMSFAGPDFAGTVQQDGATFDLIGRGGKVYLRVTSEFLALARIPAAPGSLTCAEFCGDYIELSVAETGQFTGNLSMKALADQVFSAKVLAQAQQSDLKFVPATLRGRPVLRVSQDGYAMDVTTGRPQYPVLFADRTQRIQFSDWDSVILPAAPPAWELVSVSTLAGLVETSPASS